MWWVDALKNPAVYAALSGLMGALGWENADKFFDHMVGAIGAFSGLTGVCMGAWRAWQDKKDATKP